MTTIRRITVSQINGNDADNTSIDEIRPFGETAFYLDTSGQTDKLTLMMFDGNRTHRKSKVLSPGVLYGSNADSGDGLGYDTIKLIPDADLKANGSDQYLIIDPTTGEPGHIHIRAGGNIDQSSADLIVGGEYNNVRVSDTNDRVTITASQIGEGVLAKTWMFDNLGVLTIPSSGATYTIGESEPGLVFTSTAGFGFVSNINGDSQYITVNNQGVLYTTSNIQVRSGGINADQVATLAGTIINVPLNAAGDTIDYTGGASLIEVPTNADTNQVQAGWIITFNGGARRTVSSVGVAGGYTSIYYSEASPGGTLYPLTIESADYVAQNDGNVYISANVANVNNRWTFSGSGMLNTASNLSVAPLGLFAPAAGTRIYQGNNELLEIISSGNAGGQTTIGWSEDPNAVSNIAAIGFNALTSEGVNIVTGNFGTTPYVWSFDNTGNLTLPGAISGTSDAVFGHTTVGEFDVNGVAQFTENVEILKNLTVYGNINYTGNVTQNTIISQEGIFTGADPLTGFGALYAGISQEPLTFLPSTVFQINTNSNEYTQMNYQNLNGGNTASAEYVITADNGTDLSGYLDIGMASSGWDGTQSNSLGNAAMPNDGWMYVQNGTGTSGGHLLLGTTSANKKVKIVAGGAGSGNIVAEFSNTGLSTNNITASGNASVTGNVTVTGNVSANTFVGNLTGTASAAVDGVVTTGTYANPSWITSLAYSKLTGAPTLATVATSGSYNDLADTPTIPSAYTLPTASGSTLGGIKIGTGLSIDGSGVVTTSSAPSLVNGSNTLKLVSAPTTLAGANGDTAGSIAIDGGYIYYCTRNWTGATYTYNFTTNASSASQNAYLPPANTTIGTLVYIQGPLPIQPTTGWTLTYGGSTYNIAPNGNPNNGNLSQVYLTTSGVSIPANSAVTITAPSNANIWTRTAWNGIDRFGVSASVGAANTTTPGGSLAYNVNTGAFSFTPAVTSNPTFTAGLAISGSLSATAWGTNGVGFRTVSTTYTDATSPAGTVTNNMVHAISAPTLTAPNAITYTNAATMYIANAPTAGANVTLTKPYSLYVANGTAYFGSSTAASSTTTGAVVVNGGLGVGGTVYANNFVGNITITGNVTGTSANVELVAGSYTATFDNTGKLVLPSMGGDEGGEINLGIPSSNTSLQNRVAIDVFQDRLRFFEGSANAKGAYIDLSQAGNSVGTLLNNRISAYVNAGTFVTMDNLKVTVPTSGNRSLSVASVSGTFSAFINGLYSVYTGGTGGTGASITVTTTPALAINWNFTSQGDTVTYIINDTTNSRCYRVTLMIGGSYNNNMISIERLI